MSARRTAPPVWSVVQESFEEAEFLWGRWEAALDSHRYTLDDVADWVEDRLLGAVDGVILGAGRAIEELMAPALGGRRRRPALVAAFALASMGRRGDDVLLEALCSATEDRIGDLTRGMQLTRDEQAPARWLARAGGLPPTAQAAIVGVYAFRQLPAPSGMNRAVDRDALPVQLRSLDLAATTRAAWARPYIDWGLERSNPALRIAAARAGMILGLRRARHAARDLVAAGEAGSDVLLPALGLAYGDRALRLLTARVERSTPTREVFDALTGVGTIAAGDVCAQLLHREPRLAAEALRAVAGGEVDGSGIDSDDDELPVPEPDDVRTRWARLRRALVAEQRYFGGRLLQADGLVPALRGATTRRRHLLASDLALRTGGLARVVTSAWTMVQKAQVQAAGPR